MSKIKKHVGAIGFSAGGHLCGMLGTMFDAPQVISALRNNAKYYFFPASPICQCNSGTGFAENDSFELWLGSKWYDAGNKPDSVVCRIV